MSGYKGYIDTKFKPNKKYLIAEYTFEPSKGISFEKAANHIAGESSIGTWVNVGTLNAKIKKTLRPYIFYVNEKRKTIKVAYHQDLFEEGNMPQILSSIGGNIFGMNSIKTLRLEDISFPEKLLKSFKGPSFGIQGIRKLLGVKKRPLVGTIVKPKVGLNEKEHAKVAYNSWAGGCDVVKDDENLSSMTFNKFKKRIALTLKMRDKAEKETGEKKIYMPNITAETFEMIKRAKYVKSLGGKYIMVDIITMGWAALQTIRDQNFKMVMHAHRAGHAALTRGNQGYSMLTVAKVARLIGVDQLHIGTAHVGKMEGSTLEIQDIERVIEDKSIKENSNRHVLQQDWLNIKPVFAVASGGLHPGSVSRLIERMGTDIIIQAGGGIHWNPRGSKYGAMGMRQAVNAVMLGISLKEYAKTHRELKEALDKFGEYKG
ncbi:MAG: type III ribulose-bisphosphate carboxylase [Nanoarchaeota archaeon]|nr:type III ribulose-bisphosphate carboxylase [Nanoarchaeota archaeon]